MGKREENGLHEINLSHSPTLNCKYFFPNINIGLKEKKKKEKKTMLTVSKYTACLFSFIAIRK